MKLNETREALLARLTKLDNPRDILKAPELKQLFAEIKTAPVAERAQLGQSINALRMELIAKVEEMETAQEQAGVEPLDVTAPFDNGSADCKPARPQLLPVEQATLHPLTLELRHVVDVYTRMGFVCEESRQIDDDYHMFSSLNFPPDHPARDGYDTFRTEEGYIPPAHTTAMENRVLSAGRAKLDTGGVITHVSYGRVFRNEDADVTHDHTFNQYEGVYVSADANLGQMLGMLQSFFETYYNQKLRIKTQPGYFPFTEPSLEFQIEKPAALGGGGKGGEWLEMLGCGMLHPNVLKAAGINPTKYRGFAWGGGLERLVMLKYGIEDLRHFESGKLAFLRKFRG
ncbi:MAG: hypothetical protein Q4C83_02150 [Candidatus Saccharibacteria bacterium]|nr:hypothetical protein [Candidatus Saccharibacteria bacterium]